MNTSIAQAELTKALLGIYKEKPQTTGFLRSFFPEKLYATRHLSLMVQRGSERVSGDVVLGSIGNRFTFSKKSEKVFIPPYLRNYFDATQLDGYNTLFASESISSGVFTAFLEEISEKLGVVQDTMERRHELMCAEVLRDGTLKYDKGVSVDFHRKAASKVTNIPADYWTAAGTDPFADLAKGAKFLREEGKSQTGAYNVIMGEGVITAYLANTKVKERADILNYSLDNIVSAQKMAIGKTYHGRISVGSYLFDLWTYPESYETAGGVNTPYLDNNKFVILPQNPNFLFGYAAVPQLPTLGGGVKKGKYIFKDFVDERESTHDFDIQSAGMPIPKALDQMYTAQVIA